MASKGMGWHDLEEVGVPWVPSLAAVGDRSLLNVRRYSSKRFALNSAVWKLDFGFRGINLVYGSDVV
jgi:hypothetical protein